MNNKKSYRIIKLVNGEDIIGEIVESTSKALSIFRPFEMKQIILSENEESLYQTEVLMMRNWLNLSTELKGIIAKKNIILVSTPKDNIIKCYEEEKRKEDDPNYISKKKQNLLDKLEEMEQQNIEEYEVTVNPEDIERILNDIFKNKYSNEDPEDPEDHEEYKDLKNSEDQDTDKDMFGH
jgi:hypothetical protein